mgnify:CR=1 FL=1|jgi:hypothetical protein
MQISYAHYSQIFEIVKKHIDKADPYGLIATGCPHDEFDFESAEITELIVEKDLGNAAKLAPVIAQVLNRSFEDNYTAEEWKKTAWNICKEIHASPFFNEWPLYKMHDAVALSVFLDLEPQNKKEGYNDILILVQPFEGTSRHHHIAAMFHNCAHIRVGGKTKLPRSPISSPEFDTVSVWKGKAYIIFNSIMGYLEFDYKKFDWIPLD